MKKIAEILGRIVLMAIAYTGAVSLLLADTLASGAFSDALQKRAFFLFLGLQITAFVIIIALEHEKNGKRHD